MSRRRAFFRFAMALYSLMTRAVCLFIFALPVFFFFFAHAYAARCCSHHMSLEKHLCCRARCRLRCRLVIKAADIDADEALCRHL